MHFLARVLLALVCTSLLPAQSTTEKRTYGIEWRLIRAGTMTLEYSNNHASMHLESSGIVSSLFKVDDLYNVGYLEPNCAISSLFNSKEGKRQHETRVTYDKVRNRAFFVERDLLKNKGLTEDSVEIPNCVSDVVGALLRLHTTDIQPGQTTQVPVSDGRRFAQVKIQAQEREEIKTPTGTFKTVRYEADIMNGVVYTRKGRVDLWLTDDPGKVAVQIRIRMSFPVGTVTLQLEKAESKGKPMGFAEASK